MKIVVTGGAGFIGSNAAHYFLQKKAEVVVFDNLSRAHTDKNLSWLTSHGGNLTFIHGDMRSGEALGKLMPFLKKADAVLHLAGQVAVTTSITNPREDFEINALGTLNLLEAMRAAKSRAKLIYSSTNKVYGSMDDVKVIAKPTRYAYADLPYGVDESRTLDFHSPYGCSKGSADQYVHDYGRIYGLDTVVMRQSCIYGPRQFGIEDQGWVAWFLIAIISGKPLTIYGDGKQVRDLLYIDDLVHAYDMAIAAGKKTRGGIYNIGGGPENTMSVWHEFAPIVRALHGKITPVARKGWRAGDQKVFIADIRRAKREFGWEPTTSVTDGVQQLYDWIAQHTSLFS